MYKRSTKIADLNLLLTVFIVLLHSLYNRYDYLVKAECIHGFMFF